MNQGLKYGLSKGIRLFVGSMAVFFSLLAVLDSFVKRAEIVYTGEFVSEADYRFIELPNTLQIPSANKITKHGKIEVIHPLVSMPYPVLELLNVEDNPEAETIHIFLPISRLLKFSLNTHAP
jgi:hypothetical protein